MKKSSFFVAAAVVGLVGIVAQSQTAQAEVSARPGPVVIGTVAPPNFVLSTVKGVIKTGQAPLPGAPLTGFNCDDLYVSATSKEQVPPAPGNLFSTPKWTRGAKATGSWASGQCTFTVIVPPNTEFYVQVSPSNKDYPCDYITGMTITPGASPMMSVPKGQSKNTPDFVAQGKPACGYIY